MPEVSTIYDERDLLEYIEVRNAPKITLETGVHPNCKKADLQYDDLLISLGGGNDTLHDMSQFASYHAGATASVAPFINTIRVCMDGITDTMEITNQLAVLAGHPKTFAVPDGDIDLPTYVQKLQSAISVLTATIQFVQQLGGGQ